MTDKYGNYASNHELTDTVTVGNRLAREIIAKGPQPNYNATLRHAMATNGPKAAMLIAVDLLKVSETVAWGIIAKLSTTKPDDIVSPHVAE